MNPQGIRGARIKPDEREQIESVLRRVSIFEASKLTGRPISTLAKIAEAINAA